VNDVLNEILANAVAQNQQRNIAQPPTLSVIKQAQVAQVSANKIANMGGAVPTAQQMYAPLVGVETGAGAASADPMETDIRTMGTSDLERKYGYGTAAQMIANRATANNSIFADQTQQRDWNQTAADLISGVGLGAVNSIGGIGAMGLGMVNADAGQAAATKLEDFGNFVHGTQSLAVQQRRKVLAAADQMDKRDNDLQYEKDKAAGKGITADLARFGRGFVDGIANAAADPITLSDGIAEGSGSFLALAPVSRAANAAKLLKAAAAKDAAIVAGKSADEAAVIAKGIMAKDGMAIPAAIGAMEAGGAYQGTVAEIGNMTHEQLLAGSPDYAKMIAAGVSPEEARTSVANKAGLLAAAITAPLAMAAGSLVKGFEGNPLKMGANKVAAMNMGKETIEESSQGITGAFASNLGIQTFADSNKSLSENVGEQGGRGALYGLGTAGVMAAPSVLGSAVKSTAGSALDLVINRADAYLAKNEADSPASINRVVEQSDEFIQNAPGLLADFQSKLAPAATDTPEVAATKATLAADIPAFLKGLQLNEQDLAAPELQAALPVIGEQKTRIGAIRALAEHLKDATVDDISFEKTRALMSLLDSTEAALSKLNGVDTDLLGDPEITDFVNIINSTFGAVASSPEVMAHYAATQKRLQSAEAQAILNNPVQTPETAQIVILDAQTALTTGKPIQASSKAIGTSLKMAKDGRITLTLAQREALLAAQALIESAQVYDAELTASGIASPAGVSRVRDIVGSQIKTSDSVERDVDGQRSAMQHVTRIRDLVNKGDIAGAGTALEMFGLFIDGQNNKVAGVNNHFNAGEGAPRQQVQVLSPKAGYKMAASKTLYGVEPKSTGSLNFVKKLAAEAEFLVGVYNGLAIAYPSLLGQARTAVKLQDGLQGTSAVVAAEFTNGKRGYPQQQKLTLSPATTTPAAPVVKGKKERLTTEERPNNLAQINAELELRKSPPTPETTSVTQTPEAIQAESNQAAQEGSTATVAETTPTKATGTTVQSVDTTELTATPAEYGEAVRVQESSDESDLDNAPERILQLVQALNDGVKINVVPAAQVAVIPAAPDVVQEPRTEAQQKQIIKLQKEIEIYDAFMKCLKGK
jgi:hypothetical protein